MTLTDGATLIPPGGGDYHTCRHCGTATPLASNVCMNGHTLSDGKIKWAFKQWRLRWKYDNSPRAVRRNIIILSRDLMELSEQLRRLERMTDDRTA